MPDTNQPDPSDKRQLGHAYSWLSDHGKLGFEQLQQSANEDTPESLEKLHELADDNNITYDESTDPMLLAEKINQATETDENTGVE